MKLLFSTILLIMVVAVSASPKSNNKIDDKIRFILPGRDLPSKGKFGSYAKVFLSEQSGERTQLNLGAVGTWVDPEPDSTNLIWAYVIEFDFDRSKDQQIHFEIWEEDNLHPDHKVATGTINAADFVDKGLKMNVTLSPEGTLRLHKLSFPVLEFLI